MTRGCDARSCRSLTSLPTTMLACFHIPASFENGQQAAHPLLAKWADSASITEYNLRADSFRAEPPRAYWLTQTGIPTLRSLTTYVCWDEKRVGKERQV